MAGPSLVHRILMRLLPWYNEHDATERERRTEKARGEAAKVRDALRSYSRAHR